MKFGRKLITLSIGTVLLALVLAVLALPAFAADRIQTTGSYVNVRTAATTKSAVIGKITKGNTYPVIQQANGWFQITLPSGQKGWVAGWLVKKVTATQTPQKTGTSQTPNTTTGTKGVITGSSVNIRSGPGTSYSSLGKASKGQSLTILKQQGTWYQVKLDKGTQGWVASWLVQKTTATTTPAPSTKPTSNNQTGSTTLNLKGTITGSCVNLRSGPGTTYSIVTKAYKGTTVTILKQQGDWYQVRLSQGTQGWVAGWLVTTVSGSKTEPSSGPAGGQTGGSSNQGNGSADPAKLSISVSTGNSFPVVSISGNTPLQYKLEYNEYTLSYTLTITNAQLTDGEQDLFVGQAGLTRVKVQQATTENVLITLTIEEGLRFASTLSSDKKLLTLTGTSASSTKKIVAIDAGHGGIDPGAMGPSKLQEKTVVLAISKKLAELLEQAGYTVILTRPDDVKVPLTERADIAGRNNADIFVSIHANASESSAARGTSTYYYAPDSVASLKAQASQRSGLAQKVQDRVVAAFGRRDIGILQANFAVLRETTMPSILVETAYISNPEEEKLLGQDSVQDTIAQAIFQGIEDYFGDNP